MCNPQHGTVLYSDGFPLSILRVFRKCIKAQAVALYTGLHSLYLIYPRVCTGAAKRGAFARYAGESVRSEDTLVLISLGFEANLLFHTLSRRQRRGQECPRSGSRLRLTEDIADLVHKGFVLEILVFDLGELFEKLRCSLVSVFGVTSVTATKRSPLPRPLRFGMP